MVIYKYDSGVELGSTENQLQRDLNPGPPDFTVLHPNYSATLPTRCSGLASSL